MEYRDVCAITDLPPETMKGFKCGDLDVLLANVAGQVYAVEGLCPHMSGYLARGRLEGETVICPVHGAKYSVKSGQLLKDIPWILKKLSKTAPRDLLVNQVRVDGGKIAIDI